MSLCVLVCGGRDYNNRKHVFDVLDDIDIQAGIATVIHGACGWDEGRINRDTPKCFVLLRGADRLADEWARIPRDPGVGILRVPARWQTEGRAAGPLRNKRMLDLAINVHGLDLVVAFPGGQGTAGMVKLAQAAGIEVQDEREARRVRS